MTLGEHLVPRGAITFSTEALIVQPVFTHWPSTPAAPSLLCKHHANHLAVCQPFFS